MALPFIADGYGLDRALAALLWGARAGETVSVMAARSRNAGRWTGCAVCRLLGLLVEANHCDKALATGDGQTARPAALRAGVLLILYAAAVVAPFVLIASFL